MIDPHIILGLMTALLIKHFVFDFPLQGPYQYLNKGTYGHMGGIQHSGLHALATFLVLSILFLGENSPNRWIVPVVVFIEFLVHYHTDWAKVQINKKYGWDCKTSAEFWTLLGVDQLVHALTYVWICWMVVQYLK